MSKVINLKTVSTNIVLMLLLGQVALAENPKVERSIGNDGVPVITITGDKTAPRPVRHSQPVEVPEKKAFRVYQLEGRSERKTETKIVVLSSPPPIAPSGGGYGYWYGDEPYYGGFFPGSYYGNRCNVGFPPGYSQNYQTPPLNYQTPPVNYQNPPVNYQPIPSAGLYRNGGTYRGRCR